MKLIRVLIPALAAACALMGITASASIAATCVRVDEPNTGNWTNAACTEKVAGLGREWIKIQDYTNPYGIFAGQWCAETEEENAGDYIEATCTTKGANAKYIRVYVPPAWVINGKQLKQGSQQIKLQLKGSAVLKSEVGKTPVEIECKGGTSEGATIDGNGKGSGQGKGRISFTSCKSAQCPPAEPIITNQIKSHLGTISGHQSKYAEIFEPTSGEVFTALKLGGACAVTLNVTGKVAAEILPGATEVQEGALVFPETPISAVSLEGQEIKPKLSLGPKEAKLTDVLGARLASNEKFGVFGGN